jgi:hypothetical protein
MRRVLRLAGTHDRKDGDNPKPVNKVHDGGSSLTTAHLEVLEGYASRGASAPMRVRVVHVSGEPPGHLGGAAGSAGTALTVDIVDRSDIERNPRGCEKTDRRAFFRNIAMHNE